MEYSRILSKILELKKDFDADWQDDLIDLNIWEDVNPLYFKFHGDNRKANIIMTYIALAYDKTSKRIDLHMDRMEIKRRILISLAGPHAMEDDDYIDAAVARKSPYNEIVEFYINFQQDRRFYEVISSYDHHSKVGAMQAMASNNQDLESAGRNMKHAKSLREEADKLVQEIQRETMVLDTSLEKEDRKNLSSRRGENFLSHEIYIKGLKEKEKPEASADTDFMDSYEED